MHNRNEPSISSPFRELSIEGLNPQLWIFLCLCCICLCRYGDLIVIRQEMVKERNEEDIQPKNQTHTEDLKALYMRHLLTVDTAHYVVFLYVLSIITV